MNIDESVGRSLSAYLAATGASFTAIENPDTLRTHLRERSVDTIVFLNSNDQLLSKELLQEYPEAKITFLEKSAKGDLETVDENCATVPYPLTPSILWDTLVTLLGQESPTADQVEDKAENHTRPPTGDLRNKKLLLVEDNEINQHVITRIPQVT